jgi:hypothetical protein
MYTRVDSHIPVRFREDLDGIINRFHIQDNRAF